MVEEPPADLPRHLYAALGCRFHISVLLTPAASRVGLSEITWEGAAPSGRMTKWVQVGV